MEDAEIIRITMLLGKSRSGICALCHALWPPSIVVHHKVNGSNIPRTGRLRITKIYTHIDSNRPDSHTEYDVTSYFQMLLRWFRVEFIESCSSEDHQILRPGRNNHPHKPAGYHTTVSGRL